MNEEETLEQLYSLIDDRRNFITEKDLVALETIIGSYKHDKICLSGYRESILRQHENVSIIEDILVESKQLKDKNNKYKEVIDKLKEEINNNMYSYDDGEDCGVDCCCDGFKLLDILNEVEK